MDIAEIKRKIERLLPNKGAVLSYVWDELRGPLPEPLDRYMTDLVGDYGSWKQRHRKDGQLAFEGWLYRGKRQGRWRYLYRTGAPRKDCVLRKGQYHGRCARWREDGYLEICDYRKGKRHGDRFGIAASGEVRFKSVYKNGRLTAHLHGWQLDDVDPKEFALPPYRPQANDENHEQSAPSGIPG